MRVWSTYAPQVTESTIFIGHSLGGAFLLRVLEHLQRPIAAAFIVSAPIGVRPIKNWETDQPFIGHQFNRSKISGSVKEVHIFHAQDDPLVGIENARVLSKKISGHLHESERGGHFNNASGFAEFPELLGVIERALSPGV